MKINRKAASRAIGFIENLTLTGNWQGQQFKLRPWQKQIISKLFGTVGADGLLQYRKLFLFLPRKQAKTSIAAAILLFCLLGRGKKGQEIYSVASDREQAALIFKAACQMIRADAWLNSQCEITESKKKIACPATNNVYQALSSEASSAHGKRPDVILWDEIHCQKDRELWEAMNSAFGATIEPLTLILSTAGEDKAGLCRELLEYSRKVESGIIKDETFLPILYQADESDDWRDEKTWRKAMPALGDFCQLRFIRDEFQLAQELPAEEYKFRTYYLNQFVGSEASWLPDSKWMACKKDFKLEDLYGKPAWVGVDCSVTTDFSAAVIAIPHDGVVYVHPMFWIPLNVSSKRERRDPALWRGWQSRGIVKITDGDVLDRAAIADDIHELGQKFEVQQIGFDRAHANDAAMRLRDVYGYNVTWVSQSLMDVFGPLSDLETDILQSKIAHDGNPCLRWMISNAKTTKPTAQGCYMLTKGASGDKIDGVIALLMSHRFARAANLAPTSSVYDERGMLFV